MSDEVAVDADAVWPADAADVEEGVLGNWFVSEGGSVERGEALCEIQVEKVSVDVPAPAAGALTERLVAEGETFRRGDPLGRIRPAE
jgi:pyruvate/2-oxoglutarate dehydrogenase complex dihydrolipoamide acyltransferase (E2) component